MVRHSIRLLILVCLASIASGQEAGKMGLEPGAVVPGSFDPFNINGKWKNRFHCLVCEHGLNPVVMIFTREPAEGKDEGINELLQKLDELVEKKADFPLGGFVVFLSPDSRSSATEAKVEDAAKLVEEAITREALEKRLAARAEKLKRVVVSHYPTPGPKGYPLDGKAETTVVFYDRHIVRISEKFSEGALTSAAADEFLQKVNSALADSRKRKR